MFGISVENLICSAFVCVCLKKVSMGEAGRPRTSRESSPSWTVSFYLLLLFFKIMCVVSL